MIVSTWIRKGGDKGGLLDYVIRTDEECATQSSEPELAQMKLIASNSDTGVDGSSCLFLWTCRTSREGVHAFCSKPNISPQQKEWIYQQYEKFNLTPVEVDQNIDYKDGPCFNPVYLE